MYLLKGDIVSAVKPTRIGTPVVCELLDTLQYSWDQARLRGMVEQAEAMRAILESVDLEATLQERPVDDFMVSEHVKSHIQRRRAAAFADVQLGKLDAAKREIHLVGFLEGMLPAWGIS